MRPLAIAWAILDLMSRTYCTFLGVGFIHFKCTPGFFRKHFNKGLMTSIKVDLLL